MAEGTNHRFDLFPSMKQTNAYEGIVNKGEMLFVPAIGIHVFESIGPSLGIRYMNLDQLSSKFGRQLLKLKSKVISTSFVEYLESLTNFIEEDDEKVPTTLYELQKQIIEISESYKLIESQKHKIRLPNPANAHKSIPPPYAKGQYEKRKTSA